MMIPSVIFIGMVISLGLVQGSPLTVEQLTKEQYLAIGEMRELVKNELTQEYMWEDAYLSKWLLKSNFNLGEAVKMLREHLQWRRAEKIDSILEEDWQDMHSRFPYTRETLDKNGRPLLYYDLGQWDIASFVSEGDSSTNRLGRYFVKLMEESEAHVRRLRTEGSNVTQFNLLINMGGYSNDKHVCLQCIYFYRNIGPILAAQFPLSTEQNLFVNVPYLYKMVYSVLSDQAQNDIRLYGQDQEKWEPALLDLLERDQVPGGLLDGILPAKDNSEGLIHWAQEL